MRKTTAKTYRMIQNPSWGQNAIHRSIGRYYRTTNEESDVSGSMIPLVSSKDGPSMDDWDYNVDEDGEIIQALLMGAENDLESNSLFLCVARAVLRLSLIHI